MGRVCLHAGVPHGRDRDLGRPHRQIEGHQFPPGSLVATDARRRNESDQIRMAGGRECVREARHHCDDIALKTELDQCLVDGAGEDAAAGGHDVPARCIALRRQRPVEQRMSGPCHTDEAVAEDELRADFGGEGSEHAEFEVDLAVPQWCGILPGLRSEAQSDLRRGLRDRRDQGRAEQRDEALAGTNGEDSCQQCHIEARSAHSNGEKKTRIDLASFIDSIAYDYQDTGKAVSAGGRIDGVASTKPDALRRILSNFIDNALKFAGAAEIDVERREDGAIAITALDRGPGIPEEMLAAAMQPFFRLERSRNRETGGTGLGLAIAQQLAATIGGSVRLSNRTGGGLVAEVVIP